MTKSKDQTGATRQATFRENRKKDGLVLLRRYVKPEDVAPIDELIGKRKAARAKALESAG